MLGMKKTRMPLMMSVTPDSTNVTWQWVSSSRPTRFEPNTLPSRPNISDMQTAIALVESCAI